MRIWVIEYRVRDNRAWKLTGDPPFRGKRNAKSQAAEYNARCNGYYRAVAYERVLAATEGGDAK